MGREPEHLLLVVGNELIRGVMCDHLKYLGYNYTIVENVSQAQDIVHTRLIDLILLSINLPDRNDSQFLERLKVDDVMRHIPVIILTDREDLQLIDEYIKMGAQDYISGPFSPEILKARITACLQKKSLQDEILASTKALKEVRKLANDLIYGILPIGIALSEEKNLDQLLLRILKEGKSVCNADGGTLYLREENLLKFAIMLNDSLKITITGNDDKRASLQPLRLYDEVSGNPNTHNVATSAAILGRSINVPDIYNAKDFDFSGTRTFDQKNGYRSISCLTVPLKNYHGEVTGVLQLLNAQDPQTNQVIPFGSYMQQVAEALASQAAIVLNNRVLLERQKELLKYEHELKIGQQIQAGFLPAELPQPSGWEIAARFHPAREVAGDFYDAFYLGISRKVGVVIADVTDKGVGAALYMALFRTLIRAFAKQKTTDEISLNSVVERINDYILQNHLQANMFATLFWGVLDPDIGVLEYVNAGHNPPVIVGSTGVKAYLKPTGPAVGVFPDVRFKVHKVSLEPDDILLAFTDGVTEARDSNGNFFTEKRLLQLLEQSVSSVDDLLDRIEESLRAHVGDAVQFDDITAVAVKRIAGGC